MGVRCLGGVATVEDWPKGSGLLETSVGAGTTGGIVV